MFSGNEDQNISLDDAKLLTKTYRDANPNAILGVYFGQTIINEILSQPNCVGIRMYFGIGADGKPEPVLTGVYANGNDIVNGVLGDRSMKCPPYSGASNPLNS